MSAFVERPIEISKTEWLESLQRLQVTRTDMNRLVMNYLVTGRYCGLSLILFLSLCLRHPAKANVFRPTHCPIRLFVHLFIRSDIVTTISHEWLEQF